MPRALPGTLPVAHDGVTVLATPELAATLRDALRHRPLTLLSWQGPEVPLTLDDRTLLAWLRVHDRRGADGERRPGPGPPAPPPPPPTSRASRHSRHGESSFPHGESSFRYGESPFSATASRASRDGESPVRRAWPDGAAGR